MSGRGMPADPVERAAAVASDYEALQGLITVGMGLGLLVMSASATPAFGAVWIGVAVAVGQGYYYKRYGRVRYRPGRTVRALVVAMVVVALGTAGIVADVFAQLPILLGPLLCAAGLLIFFKVSYQHVGVTWAHLAATAGLAACSLLPLTVWFAEADGWRLDLIVFGLVFIVVGLVDHLRLVRAMGPVGDD